MTVSITAVFPNLESAQSAAECMAVCPNHKNVHLSLEYCDHEAANTVGRILHGIDTGRHEQGIYTGGRHQNALLRIRCSDQLSSFVMRELAALGAEKISMTTPS